MKVLFGIVGVLAASAVVLGLAKPRSPSPEPPGGALGTRVFVVERNNQAMSVYDFGERRLVGRVAGLGNLQHATMTFSRDLRWGFVASRGGLLSRVNLATLAVEGQVKTSEDSIDIAISQDGRFLATAEYRPGGVTILDVATLAVAKRIPACVEREGRALWSRATGIVDAPGNRFVCTLIEEAEVWVIDASKPDFPIERKIKLEGGEPYDAMITPDGRWYVVGHLESSDVSVIDLTQPERTPTRVSLLVPGKAYDKGRPAKLPHLACWAMARGRLFVPMVGDKKLVVLDPATWKVIGSIDLKGNPVYAVRMPGDREIWVSFSGEEDDAYLQAIDAETLEVKRTWRVGARIYHIDFTPRGSHALVSANKENKLFLLDTSTYGVVDEEAIDAPSGVFGVWRAFVIGL